MDLKRFKDFMNENTATQQQLGTQYIDRIGRLRTDSDDPNEFKHSPRTERFLMYIEDIYNADETHKAKFDYMLKDLYDLDRQASSIYTDLAMAIRDQIIPEGDIEQILTDLENEEYAKA
jgi:hypothetical protein